MATVHHLKWHLPGPSSSEDSALLSSTQSTDWQITDRRRVLYSVGQIPLQTRRGARHTLWSTLPQSLTRRPRVAQVSHDRRMSTKSALQLWHKQGNNMYTYGIGSSISSSRSSSSTNWKVTETKPWAGDIGGPLPTGVKTCLFYRKSKPTPLST